MPETPQPKSDVQTLLDYFQKLLDALQKVIYLAAGAVSIVLMVFVGLLCNSKEEATAKVLDAENKKD
ncbi:MAG: hypothetical protein IPM82_28610 [Saprospiraceae bacterium]|nr:hypothetical protein [Saprospiraceae bacterium]